MTPKQLKQQAKVACLRLKSQMDAMKMTDGEICEVIKTLRAVILKRQQKRKAKHHICDCASYRTCGCTNYRSASCRQ